MTRKIFISYRRADNSDFVERIRDWFADKYGDENVFMDFYTIPYFVKFADFIREKVRESDVIIAIIGPDWIRLLREKESSGDEDFVRMELAVAIEEDKLIAPILIKGGQMPRHTDMPTDLRSLADYNAASLDSGRHFLDNIERIMNAVEQELTHRTSRKSSVLSSQMTAEDYFKLGQKRARKGDHIGAIMNYTEAIRLKPDYANAYANRALSRYKTGDYDRAITDDLNALQLNPNDKSCYANLADSYYKLNHYEEALDAYESYVALSEGTVDQSTLDRVTELKQKVGRK